MAIADDHNMFVRVRKKNISFLMKFQWRNEMLLSFFSLVFPRWHLYVYRILKALRPSRRILARETGDTHHRKVIALLIAAPCLFGCNTMKESVLIQASPKVVWSVVTDLEKYPEWNPFFIQASGLLTPGEKLTLMMQPVGKTKQKFTPKVMEVAKDTTLSWRGRVIIPGLFDGYHTLTIKDLGNGSVEFVQLEKFKGLLVPFLNFKPYRQGWIKMNESLKQRAEKL